ncbi:MAG: type II toxin-antitoxin system HicB family antitoxin [Planctomycetota bacterium]
MKQYTVIYEWAGKSYSAYVPDLPGCVACGDTLEETEALMKEAVELYIEALKEGGKPVPEPTTKARPIAVVG